MTDRRRPWAQPLANLLVMAVAGYAYGMHASSPAFFYASLQEDEYLEWATFWAFLLATALFVAAALRQRRSGVRVPWFLLGLAAFCFVVGMEEISWGQRVLGYRPPAYFLENNFQQELNFHNVLSTSLRKLGLKASIVAYGVVLPLVVLVPAARRWAERWAVVAPPVGLLPAFAATLAIYQVYPWKYSGEVVELMLGLALLFSAVLAVPATGEEREARRWAPGVSVATAALLAVTLGVATAGFFRLAAPADPGRREEALREVESLRADFLAMAPRPAGTPTECGLHKRLYSYVEKYGVGELAGGRYARLAAEGMPEERARYFLDPWNSPYWIRDRCADSGRRLVYVYSFGPNRKRDSTEWQVRGDDIGAVIFSRVPE